MDYIFALAIIVATLCALLIFKKIQNIRVKRLDKQLLENWGKSSDIDYRERDLSYISDYFKSKLNSDFYIDDITWSDIDMNSVFKKMNNTSSFIGESLLYDFLRKPKFKKELLDNRGALIDIFSKDSSLRVNVQKSLLKLGRDRTISIIDYVSLKEKSNVWKSVIYRGLSLFAIISLSLIAYDSILGFKLVFTAFIINIAAYYLAMMKISSDLKVINSIANLVNCCREVSKYESSELREYTDKLSELYDKVKSINSKTLTVSYSNQNELVQYIKILFLTEVVNYNRISREISKFKNEIMDIYKLLGELDALISISSYRDGLDYYSTPEISKSETPYLNIQDAYHPLVENPVSNSIDTSNSVLITGSNASGKSTFLKTLAINSILAHTVNLSLSKHHSSSYFKTLTSMALSDDIFKGESYYIVEIKSIKRILGSIRDDVPTLCLVDEILKGTNTIERISASSKILEELSSSNCLCFTATHDIELASILKNHFDSYHFKEEFKDNRIVFDYKIYSGKSRTRNAIKLLKVMGFDDSIIEDASILARNYELTGVW